MTFWSNVLVHVKRIFQGRLNQVKPTEQETKKMNDESTLSENDQVMRAFLAWRHSNLLGALPITLFSAISDLVVMGQAMTCTNCDRQYFNGLGKILLVIPFLSSPILFLTVLTSSFWWSNWRRTRLVIKTGWATSFFLPLVPAIFPVGKTMLLNLHRPSENSCQRPF
jgi:hypothetical protein